MPKLEMVKRTGLWIAGLAVLLAWVGALRVGQYVHTPISAGPVRLVIPAGAGGAEIVERLGQARLSSWPRGAAWGIRLWSNPQGLKAGTYVFSGPVPLAEVFSALEAGRVEMVSVTLPEGLTARQMAALLQEAGIVDAREFEALAYAPDSPTRWGLPGPSLEGYLFPDTYRFGRDQSARDVADAMVGRFRELVLPYLPEAARQGLDLRAWTTLASIVEKETGAAGEKPVIAAVFHNRLARGMRLESDPTVIYGIPDFDGNIRRRDLVADTPYNTYTRKGLPPGAIANPGLDSLRAVLTPEEVPYLYFVSRNDGTHQFSTSYEEHRKAVRRYQGGAR